ncbi:MAG: methyltransferase domain-containing protein [Pseudomonadota bacterium]
MASEQKAETRTSRLKHRLSDQVRFMGALVRAPRNIGAVAPSSRRLAKQMASFIDRHSTAPVLELGPGTGAITKAILTHLSQPDRLICLEHEPSMCRRLSARFHGITIVEGDAFNLGAIDQLAECEAFDCVVSGLPLLNFTPAARIKLLRDALDRLQPGRPFVQFSYGVAPPIAVDDMAITRTVSPWIMKNLPPARIWSYVRVEPTL